MFVNPISRRLRHQESTKRFCVDLYLFIFKKAIPEWATSQFLSDFLLFLIYEIYISSVTCRDDRTILLKNTNHYLKLYSSSLWSSSSLVCRRSNPHVSVIHLWMLTVEVEVAWKGNRISCVKQQVDHFKVIRFVNVVKV